MSFDSRHLVPMSTELTSLCLGAINDTKKRSGLVRVGRSIRDAHFQATDTFRSMPIPVIVERLGGKPVSISLPPVACLFGNTIGGIIAYYYIGSMVAAKRPLLAFEIGTYLGASALTMALNSDDSCRILTLDLPEGGDIATLSNGDRTLANTAMTKVGSSFRGHPLESRIQQIRDDSATMDITRYTKGQPVDFFFIDGGHSVECVSKDTETAFSCLSPDGLIMWDDYNWIFPELRGFLKSVARTHPLVRIKDTQYVVCHQSFA